MEYTYPKNFDCFIIFQASEENHSKLVNQLNSFCEDSIPYKMIYRNKICTLLTKRKYGVILTHIVKDFTRLENIIVIKEELD